MSKSSADAPEFHIVVKRPSQRGPLAPYRFAISVAVALLVTFDDLQAAIFDGVGTDAVLLRAIGAAVFSWIVLSVLNKVLAAAPPEPVQHDDSQHTPHAPHV